MRARVRLAWALLLGSLIGWPSTALTVARGEPQFVLGLSWLAITLTAVDILSTQDVRRTQAGDGGAPRPGGTMDKFRLEPARIYAVALAVLVLVKAFGIHLTDDQDKAIDGVLVVLLLGGGEAVRAAVTPNPKVRARKRS